MLIAESVKIGGQSEESYESEVRPLPAHNAPTETSRRGEPHSPRCGVP